MMARQPVSGADARTLTDVVTRLRRALRRSIRSEPSSEARPMAQVEVLLSLAESGGTRIGDLAERLRLAQSTTSALVGQLISAKLATREVDPVDRRASIVALSARGRAELAEWDSAHRRRLGAALSSLSASDQRVILAAVPVLDRLIESLD